jgi:hypothetical protein
MKKLLSDSLVLVKEVVLLQAPRELYLVLAGAELAAFLCGLLVGAL